MKSSKIAAPGGTFLSMMVSYERERKRPREAGPELAGSFSISPSPRRCS
jgi:hypothetical protein